MNEQEALKLYNALLSKGYSTDDLGDEQTFMSQMGDAGNRKELYDWVSGRGDFRIGDYDSYERRLTGTAALPQSTGQEPVFVEGADGELVLAEAAGQDEAPLPAGATDERPTAEDMARYRSTIASVNRTMKGATEGIDRLEQGFKGRMQNLGKTMPKPGESKNLVKGGQHLNSETGKLEQEYVTSQGNVYTQKGLAEMEQGAIDRAEREQRYRESLQGQLEDAYAKRQQYKEALERRASELDSNEDRSIGANLLRAMGDPSPGIGTFNDNGRREDDEYRLLNQAYRENEKRIRTLEAERDDAGFWKVLGSDLGVPESWFSGLIDIADAGQLMEIKRKIDAAHEKGEQPDLSDAEKSLLRETLLANEAENQYGGNRSAWYRAGKMGAQSIQMIPDFMIGMGPMKSIATATVKGVTKAGTKMLGRELAEKMIPKAILKTTGITAGTLAAGGAMVNTVQLPRLAGETMKNMTGELTIRDDGDYAFGHYETGDDGRPQFVEETDSFLPSLLKAEQKLIPEASSEVLGEFLPGAGKIVNKGLEKLGLSSIVGQLSRISGTGWYRSYNELLRRTGFHGVPGEAIEEYANDVHSLILGDPEGIFGDENGKGGWGDPDKHIDIWLGTATLGGLLNAPTMIGTAKEGVQYYRYRHKTNAADARARAVWGDDNWEMIRESIDNCDNEHMGTLARSVIKGDMSEERKRATLDYMYNLQKMRGYSIGDIAGRQEAEDSEEAAEIEELERSYAKGHEEEMADEKKRMVDEANAAAEGLKQYGEEFAIMVQAEEDNPANLMDYLLTHRDTFTDEQIAGAADYLQKKFRADGVMDAALEGVDLAVERANAEVRSHTHQETGNVILAQRDGEQYYVIGGEVDGPAVSRDNGRKEDAAGGSVIVGSGGAVVVKNAQTGEVNVVSPGELTVLSVDSADGLIEQNETTLRQQMMQRADEDVTFGSPASEVFDMEDTVTLQDGEGGVTEGQIVQLPNAVDGVFVVQTSDGRALQMTADEMNRRIVAHNGHEVARGSATSRLPGGTMDERPGNGLQDAGQGAEDHDYAAGESGGAESNHPAASALDRIPYLQDEKGNPILNRKGKKQYLWHKASVADASDALIESAKGDMLMARDTASDLVNQAKEKLEKVRKQKAKGDDPIEIAESRMEIQRQVDEQQAIVKQWQDVNQEIQKRMREEAARKQAEIEAAKSAEQKAREAEERRQRQEQQEQIARERARKQIEEDLKNWNKPYQPLEKAKKELAGDSDALAILDDTEPRSIEEWVSSLLRPQSLMWADEESGGRTVAGLKSELGLQWGDVQRFGGLIGGKGKGKPFNDVVHEIWEELPEGMQNQYTDQDVRNILLDLFNETDSRRMRNLAAEHRIEEAYAMAEENRRRDAEAEMESWAEFYHLSPEERESFEEWMQMPPSEVEQEIINQIIADNEQDSEGPGMGEQPDDGGVPPGVAGSEEQVQPAAEAGSVENLEERPAESAESGAGEPPVSGDEVDRGAQGVGAAQELEKPSSDMAGEALIVPFDSTDGFPAFSRGNGRKAGYGIDVSDPIGKTLADIKAANGEGTLACYHDAENGRYVFMGVDAETVQRHAYGKGLVAKINGMETLVVPEIEMDAVLPVLVRKGYKVGMADGATKTERPGSQPGERTKGGLAQGLPLQQGDGQNTDATRRVPSGGRVVTSAVKSFVQGELFSDKDFEPVPERKDSKGKPLSEMSDEELLRAIGENEEKERGFHIDEYDKRHRKEYDETLDAYTRMLEDNGTSLDDAYSMYDEVSRQWRDGGYALPERTRLLAQIDAIEPYVEEKEAERIEREEEEEDARIEQERKEAEAKYEQQKEDVRSQGYDLTKLKLRPLEAGESCHVERRYQETGLFSFTGSEHIESIDDVAFIFRELEDAAVENTFMVLEKDGVPTIIHLAIGSYSEAHAPFEQSFAAAQAIEPDKVYFVHNHPSGNLKSSRQDRDLMKKFHSVFGDKLEAGIIIDTTSGKYGVFYEYDDLAVREMKGGETAGPALSRENGRKEGGLQTKGLERKEVPMKVYSFSKQVFDEGWNPDEAFDASSSDKVAAFISSHRLGEHAKMSLIVMDQAGHVTGNVFLPWTTMQEAATPEGADLIAGYMNQMGGKRVVVYGNYKYERGNGETDAVKRLGGFLRSLNVYMQDVVHIDRSASMSGDLVREGGVTADAAHDDVDRLLDEVDWRKEVADRRVADDIVKRYLSTKPRSEEEAVRQRATKAVLTAMDKAGVPYKVVGKEEERQMLQLFSLMNQEAVKDFARQMRSVARTELERGSRYVLYNMDDPFGVPMFFQKRSTARWGLEGVRKYGGDWAILDIGEPYGVAQSAHPTGLKRAAEMEAMMGNEKTPETAVPGELSPFKATVISDVDGAKVQNNLETLAKRIENLSDRRSKTFIGDVASALGAERDGSKSEYVTIQAKNGTIVTMRLSDHNATVSSFDYRGEQEGISIVISRKPNNGVNNDGAAHIVEFFYPDKELSKASGNPYVDIIKSIEQTLYSGEYKDTTGIAHREEVNIQFMFQREGKRILGWIDGKQVYLTAGGLNPNTPLHECTHLWDKWCQKEQPELWKKVVAAMKHTAVWEEIRKNPDYRNIWEDEDRMASEVHSRLSGTTGEEEFMRAAFKKDTPQKIIDEVKSVLRKFWEAILRLFGGKKSRTIGDDWSSLEAIVRMPVRDLVEEDFGKVMEAAQSGQEAGQMEAQISEDDTRGDDVAKEQYEKEVAKRSLKWQEAWQDSMVGLKAIQDAIAAETGNVATGAEDAYRFENRMHGRAKNRTEQYDWRFYRPMLKAFNDFCKEHGWTHEQGMDYIIAKSGLERNVYYAFRDGAKAKIASDVAEERKKLEKEYVKGRVTEDDYKAKKQELEERERTGADDFMDSVRERFAYKHAKEEYDNGNISYGEYLRIIEKVIREQLGKGTKKDEARLSGGGMDEKGTVAESYYDDYQKDYSGLTETFAKKMYDDAQKIRRAAQRAIDTKERRALWKQYDEAMRQAYLTARQEAEDAVFAGEAAAIHNSQPEERTKGARELWKRINAATEETLRESYESGLIDKKAYEKVKGMFDFYIPLRGWDEDKASDVYTYMGKENVFSPAVKKTWGRTSKAEDPLAYIGNIAVSTILSGHRNLMKQHFLNYVMNNPTSLVSISESWYENIAAEGDAPFWVLRSADTAGKSGDEVAQIVSDFNEEMAAKQREGRAMPVRGRLRLNVHATSGQKSEHVVEVQRAGRTYQLYINGNPKAAQALNGSGARAVNRISDTWLGQKVAKLNRAMAEFFTSKNPAFVISNLSRDLNMAGASVAVNEGPVYNARFIANVAKVLAPRVGESSKWVPASKQPTGLMPSLLRKWMKGTLDESNETERLFKEFMDEGGETGFVNMLSVESFKEKMRKEVAQMNGSSLFGSGEPSRSVKETYVGKGLRLMGETFEFYNRCAEDATRFIVYMTSRQMGKTLEESIADAKDVTLNFNRKGTGGLGNAEARDLFIFVNPAIQALANMYRMAKGHPLKFGAVTAAFVAGGALMPIINQWLLNMLGDDDDKEAYWNLPPWVRKNNLVFWLPGTKNFVTIPLAQEFRVFYGVGEMLSSIVMDHPVNNWGVEMFSSVADLVPINPTGNGGNLMVDFVPTMVQPLMQVGLNVDFTGKPIWKENQGNKYAPQWSKAYVSTPAWMVKVSEAVNKWTGGDEFSKGVVEKHLPFWGDYVNNPAVWNHLLQGYFGGMYDTVSKAFDVVVTAAQGEVPKIYQTPVINRFLNRPVERDGGGVLGDEYYGLTEEHDELMHQVRGWQQKAVDAKESGDKAALKEANEKLKELTGSKDYARAMVIDHYKKIMDDLKKGEKAASEKSDKDFIKESESLYKQAMIEELNAIDGGKDPMAAARDAFDNSKTAAEKRRAKARIERLIESGERKPGSAAVKKARSYREEEEGRLSGGSTDEIYLELATSDDIEADVKMKQMKRKINEHVKKWKELLDAGMQEQAAVYREDNAKWFEAEQLMKTGESLIRQHKGMLGGGADGPMMKLLRDRRRWTLEQMERIDI